MFKLNRVSKSVRMTALAAVASTAIAVPVLSATTASAASHPTDAQWTAVAQCESSGNWQNHDSGGNGHYGGLQFSPSSWAAAGGLKYAPRADQATKAEQIAVANTLYGMQGGGAWQCASAGGL
ncbi:transglycosylase family protein [Streptomyces sp. PTM05]|uniref:Transglycosylase family protein n=1 Tax=Streptantibioticus parmotrematis TaxID=2873249 RepID=A0ABS7QX48_9ACTN|nr:transglycosylase family protein [Streptantibioticus parmotrematis]